MEKTLKFNSQIATSRSQSEKLLALGLKKETADMVHCAYSVDGGTAIRPFRWLSFSEVDMENFIPAWSFSRLLELLYNGAPASIRNLMKLGCNEMNYATIIDCIGDLIKLNQFNKDYLEKKK